jgi:hypothetical protein
MEWVIALVLAVFLGYLVYRMLDPTAPSVLPSTEKRLCDYYVAGSVFEDIRAAIGRGIRLVEVHVYSDEQDQPVVAKHPLNDGYDFAEDNITFEQVCVDIVNDAFPSPFPFILSVVPHTDKTIVWNRVAEHLQTTVRRHLVPDKDIQDVPLASLANKLILVSGGPIQGTAFEDMVNLSWSNSNVRRLSYPEALYPRDPAELTNFNRDFLTIVGPDSNLRQVNVHPNTPTKFGCQWNLYVKDGPGGFIEKPASLQ